MKAERARKIEQSKEVTVYEGRVPVHSRLILLCEDFIESTADMELNELLNFQGSLLGFDSSIKTEKAERLVRIIKELFKKYQIEVIQPNLTFIVNQFQSAYEKYNQLYGKGGAATLGSRPEEKKKFKEFIKFKHAPFN